MTAVTGPAHAAAPARDSWTGILRAEWTKIRSVRSTVWSLIAFVVVAIGFSALVSLVISSQWAKPGAAERTASLHADPSGVIYGPGFTFGQLALCVLGVIVISSEYSTGAIRSSLLAVPRRLPMLAAKVLVFAGVCLVASAITVFAVFFITTAILHGHIVITLGQPGMLRATLGGIAYLTVLGVFAVAVGGLIRHTAGGIATVIGIVLVLPIVMDLIPGSVAHRIAGYLPTTAGTLIAQTARQPGDVLSPWQGFGIFCLWTVVLLIACAVLLDRRDA